MRPTVVLLDGLVCVRAAGEPHASNALRPAGAVVDDLSLGHLAHRAEELAHLFLQDVELEVLHQDLRGGAGRILAAQTRQDGRAA